MTIQTYLDFLAGAGSIAAIFLLRHGRGYTERSDVSGTNDQQCYLNSWRAQEPGSVYTEGYVLPKGLIPLAHAWLVRDGLVDDLTLEPGRCEYFGVGFTHAFMLNWVVETGYPSVFESLYMIDMEREEILNYLESGLA